MVNFIIPGMYEHYALNFRLLELLKEKPEMFMDGVKVSAAYGSFQFCIFDGGRIFSAFNHTTKEEIESVVKIYNENFDVPIRLVFTNPEVEPKHFKNRFANVILSLCENDMNEVVINHPELEEYVRTNYPGFQFISSTTKCLNTPDLFKAEISKKDYKMVCLDYNLNKNWKMLNGLDEDIRNRCEFLCNAICPAGCPHRKEHYKLNGLFYLNYGQPYIMEDCKIRYNTLHPVMCNSVNNISPKEIYEKYVPAGYNLFKLEGRTLSTYENAANYVRYMVKPEYQYFVLGELLADDSASKVFINQNIFLNNNG